MNDIIELKLVGFLFGQTMINVLHFRVQTLPTDPEYVAAMQAFLTAWDVSTTKTSFLKCCPSDYTLQYATAQRVAPTREVFLYKFMGNAGTGAAANPAQDANAVLTKRTAHIGNHTAGTYTYRGSTGSVHFPGIPATAGLAGNITTAYAVDMGTFGSDLLLGLTPADTSYYKSVVWHRLFTPQPSSDDVITTVNQPQIRIMRRREVGQGI